MGGQFAIAFNSQRKSSFPPLHAEWKGKSKQKGSLCFFNERSANEIRHFFRGRNIDLCIFKQNGEFRTKVLRESERVSSHFGFSTKDGVGGVVVPFTLPDFKELIKS